MRRALAATLLLLTPFAYAGEHIVQPNETPWSIARAQQSAYPGASPSQIVWGLIQANPEAFREGPTP